MLLDLELLGADANFEVVVFARERWLEDEPHAHCDERDHGDDGAGLHAFVSMGASL